MPCNSDYMNPSEIEKNLQETAKLILYALGSTKPPQWIVDASKDMYCHEHRLVPYLCDLITSMSESDQAKIVYDGRNPKARKLADWWDEHKAADTKRKLNEAAKKLSYSEALESVLRLADELCNALDAAEDDVGGWRSAGAILKELGPATDMALSLKKKKK